MTRDVDELRMAVANALRMQICGVGDADAVPTAKQFLYFFKHKLKGRSKSRSGNFTIYDYSESRAKNAIKLLIEGKPCFDDGIGAGSNATFEDELTRYINSENIEGLPPIPRGFFRKGFDGNSTKFADMSLIHEGRDADYIVSQLFDLCGESFSNSSLLESHRLKGLFIVAAIKLSPHMEKQSIGSIVFSDLFDRSIEIDIKDIDFGECSVSQITRVNPPNKPVMSDDDFSDHIYRVYRLKNKFDGSPNAINLMKAEFIKNCIRVFAKLVIKYLEPLQTLLHDSLECGRLPRTVLDVENGALFARQVDQGRLWVLALTSIEDTVYECDELFGKSFVRSYEQALRAARGRKS